MSETEAAAAAKSGWRNPNRKPSLSEVYSTVPVPKEFGFWRKMLAFSGPGYMVAVGYMDPGNWATDLQGGSQFGYQLLWVILLSSLIAMLLQTLCARLGIATGRDLAQACRDHYPKPVAISLWLMCEVAICACDLAEIIGCAVALYLLFNIPLIAGALLTALDVIALMYLQNRGFRHMEALVVTLIMAIGGCFITQLALSHPKMGAIVGGLAPHAEIFKNTAMLYAAIGILGATVMPHNLYLHSSIVQTRKYEATTEGRREAIKFATLDSTVALTVALFINAAILIVAAATFHAHGETGVAEIQDAYKMLGPMLGAPVASVLFALALLASGQNSTLTGTLAGQIVMEGFLEMRLRPWLRRLITRLLAIIPAVIGIAIYGEAGTTKLLVLSQVVLSLQLSFAVIPLVVFTSDRRKMGEFASPWWLKILAWLATGLIVLLNLKFVLDLVGITG
jgi:manganese transport protein